MLFPAFPPKSAGLDPADPSQEFRTVAAETPGKMPVQSRLKIVSAVKSRLMRRHGEITQAVGP